MGFGIYVATSGAVARQTQIDLVANDIANAGTNGYRQATVAFEEVLRDAQAPNRHLVAVAESQVSPRPGPMQTTGEPLDLALGGAGYFTVEGPGGEGLLVRSVSAQLGPDGALRDRAGRPLLGEQGVLRVDPLLPVTVEGDGTVIQAGEPVGRLLVVDVADPRVLRALGDGSYAPTQASGDAVPMVTEVVAGALEGSNVHPVESMVRLVRLEREHQSILKAIQAYREADEAVITAATRG